MSQPNQHLQPKDAVTIEAPPESLLQHEAPNSNKTVVQKVYDCLTYVPPRCRYDPEKPFEFSMGLNVLFGKVVPALHGEETLTSRAYQHSPVALR